MIEVTLVDLILGLFMAVLLGVGVTAAVFGRMVDKLIKDIKALKDESDGDIRVKDTKNVGAYIFVTDKLLRNPVATKALISSLLRRAIEVSDTDDKTQSLDKP